MVLNIPHGTQDNPQGTQDIPHATEHPHGTQDKPPTVLKISPHGTHDIPPTILSTPHGTAHTLYRVIHLYIYIYERNTEAPRMFNEQEKGSSSTEKGLTAIHHVLQ